MSLTFTSWDLMKSISTICLLFVSLTCLSANAQDRSLEEFKEYVNGKTGGQLSDEVLQALAERVDKDSDGTISEDEFADRMSAFEEIMAERQGNQGPRGNDDSSNPKDDGAEKPGAKDDDSDRDVVSIPALTHSTDATVLLITADELAEAWVPFAEWKTLNGKLTKIVTVGQIEKDYKADSIQEKIRQCVQMHIKDHGTQWVVLGGDCLPNGKGLVPGGHTTVHEMEPRGIPTDIVYLSKTNWDADGDGVYGEFEDDQDAITYPDGSVGLGRIPVRTAEDVKAFTAKVVAYESNYPTDSFATNMIYTCTDSPAYPKVRKSWDSHVSKVWKGEMGRFFSQETPWDDEDDPGSYPLSANNLVKLFNEKSTSKFHIHGHGHLPAWVLESGQFTGRHIEKLEHDGAYPLITTVSCNTGEYDSRKDPSIVEQMLRRPQGGSVAVVAPVRTGKPHFSNNSDFRLMVTEGKLDGTTMTMTRYWTLGLGEGNSTGHAMMNAKKAMIEDARDAACYHLCICELNLLGDPTLDMRAKAPRNPSLEVAAMQDGDKYNVTVKTDAPGATVCLWKGTDVYQVLTADKQGNASATLKANPQDVAFTVSGANLNSVTQKGTSK